MTLTMDIFATACAALGVPVPENIDGVSFWPTLLGQPEPELARDLYFVRREGGNADGGKTNHPWRVSGSNGCCIPDSRLLSLQ
jgi:arylsulfatase A-like enzyme